MSIDKLRDLNPIPRIFVYTTGAGAGIQKKIWETPGCSSFLVGCGFPYATTQTSKYIGFTPEKFVSLDTAIELAMAAYSQAYEPGCKTIGLGLTASVASIMPHRGDHRIIAATFSDSKCFAFSTSIEKGAGLERRILDSELSDIVGISLILKEALGLDNDEMMRLMIRPGEQIALNNQMLSYFIGDVTDQAKQLILSRSYYHMSGSRLSESDIDVNKVIFYPGSFNPFHIGHEQGAKAIQQVAAKQFGECRDIVFTTVANPPHKIELSASQMLNRIHGMKGKNFCLTTNDPLFINKAQRHPGGWFGMGADTLLTMLDPVWGYSISDLLEKFSKLGTKIFVLGRVVNESFITLSDIKNRFPILNYYQNIFVEVPGRWDISSTMLRNKF